MRNSMHLWRKIGQYNSARNFSDVLDQYRVKEPRDIFQPKKGLCLLAGLCIMRFCHEWLRFDARNMYENWKGEKNILAILENLDRKKKESPEAFLEMADREIKALKSKLSNGEARESEVKNYEREVAALKAIVHKRA